MENNHNLEKLVLAGSALAGPLFAANIASAEQAGPTHPTLTPALVTEITAERPLIAVSLTGDNIIIPAGGAWAGDVHESDIVPANYINHYNHVRDLLIASNQMYFSGGLINRVQMEDGSFAYVPAHSYEFFGLTGIERGREIDGRSMQLDLTDAPAYIRSQLGAGESVIIPYTPDVFDATHYRTIEIGNLSNWIGFAREQGLTDDEVRHILRINAAHTGEGVPDANQIFVLRYDSHDNDGTLDLYIGRGNMVWDAVVRCPATGQCMGRNPNYTPGSGELEYLPIGHLNTSGQTVTFPDGTVGRHWRIENCENDQEVPNPSTGTMADFSRGVLILPRLVYGAPSTHPVGETHLVGETADVDLPAPPSACYDGLDNDGDGLADRDDPGCENAFDNDETDPEVPHVGGDHDPTGAGGTIVIPDDGHGDGHGDDVPCPPQPVCPTCPPQLICPPQPHVGDGGDSGDDGSDQVPPTGDGQVHTPAAYNPAWFGGARYNFLHADGMPGNGHGAELTLGHRIGENFYLGGLVGGMHFGRESWNLLAEGQANPNDPHALLGYATDDGYQSASMLRLGAEFRWRSPLEFIQIATALGLDLTFMSGNRDVNEWLENSAGTVIDSNVYSDNLDSIIPRGFFEIGPSIRVHDNVSIDLMYNMQFDGDGVTGHGFGVGISGYWGGSDAAEYSADED